MALFHFHKLKQVADETVDEYLTAVAVGIMVMDYGMVNRVVNR